MIMDFKPHTAAAAALSKLPADALLIIVGHETLNEDLDPALAGPIRDLIASADFEIKAGRTLFLHKLGGVKAPRVVLAAASGWPCPALAGASKRRNEPSSGAAPGAPRTAV